MIGAIILITAVSLTIAIMKKPNDNDDDYFVID